MSIGFLKTKNNALQLAALFLLLVALPAGSWFYLKGGETFYLETVNSLQELGPANPQWVGAVETAGQESLGWNKRISIVGVLPTVAEEQQRFLEVVGKLYEQFSKRPDIHMVTFVPVDSIAGFSTTAIQSELENLVSEQWHFYPIVTGNNRYQEAFQLQNEQNFTKFLALVDTSLQVRNHYDYKDEESVRQLIRHIAYVMPRLPERDVEFAREQEK